MVEARNIRSNVSLLLVEDNPDDVYLMRKALDKSGLGNSLHVAEDGEEALDFLHQRGRFTAAPRPDLVLLDLNLPGKDGRQVLAEAKQDNGLKDIPIVILTTSESEEDIRASYKAHANSFVTKPMDFRRFSDLVSSLTEYWFSLVKLPSKPG